jgi:hypothetical protein
MLPRSVRIASKLNPSRISGRVSRNVMARSTSAKSLSMMCNQSKSVAVFQLNKNSYFSNTSMLFSTNVVIIYCFFPYLFYSLSFNAFDAHT